MRIAGRFDHLLPDLQEQNPPPQGPSMFVLFDLTNARALARHSSYNALAALAVIQFANVDSRITRCGENRSYSFLEADQVRSVIEKAGGTLAKGAPYSTALKTLRGIVEDAPWLLLPFEAEQLIAQAKALGPKEDKPYAINPTGTVPEQLRAWHSDPQRNVRREDCSHWVHFASGGIGGGTAVAPPPPATAPGTRSPSARPAPRRAPGATPAPPKPRAAPSGPATRPKAGTSTGKVWDIADELSKKLEGKELRKEVISRCEAEGINASTASVQFGKWKSAQ